MKATARRLSKLEAAGRAERDALAIPEWLALYRRGASVEERNRIAGPAWVAMAIQRNTEADETMVLYEQSDD